MGYTVIFDGKRECLLCRAVKGLSEFGSYHYTTKQGKRGVRYSGRCKACERERGKGRAKGPRTRRFTPSASAPHLKICWICRAEKNRDAFYSSKTTKDRLQPDCKACRIKANMEYAKGTLPIRRQVARRALLRQYGMTPDDYDAMVRAQYGKCRICGEEKPLRVDHDHVSGAVRGLLCHNCNTALGHAKENPIIIQAMLDYLKGHSGHIEVCSATGMGR